MRRALLVALGLSVIAVWPVLAFHDQGVGHCNGCHTMHNSENGQLVDPDSPNGNPFLLRDASASEVCLGCHAEGLGAVFAVDPLNPAPERGGGNFIFLLSDNINDAHNGANNIIPGYAGGHSVIAPSYGLDQDPVLATAPGAASTPFPSSQMSCTSCHDPHGNTSFRLLYGAGQVQAFYTFVNPAPVAEGLSLFGPGESNSNHTAYQGSGTNAQMSAWCGNCHGSFHNNNTQLIHPSGQTLGGTISLAYGLYNGTDDVNGGAAATSYLAAVPFEDAANTTSSTAGPGAGSLVSCVSCHRAHATSATDAGRWDFNVTFLHEDGVESGSYQIPDPYASLNQRSLCNKCHVKDANSGPFVP